jgi:hypothetical protein
MPGLRLAMLAGLLLLAGCGPDVRPIPFGAEGPTLEIVAVNRMDRDATIAIEFAGDNVSGSGEGGILACSASTMGFGSVGSHVTVVVDGVQAWEGDLPANVGDGIVMMRLDIGADGEVTVGAPAIVMRPPQVPPNLAGC